MSRAGKHRAAPTTPAQASGGLRPEIQVLRAVAVLAVVVNHLWPHGLTGGYLGVDVFFVISGYLITAHLLRELDGTGRVRLGRFWARRTRRLLPAGLLVLLFSAVGTLLLVPVELWQATMRQVTASALYVQNWALARDAQDYFASGDSASPVTHYWSLSVEEQFYLVWPLLAFGAYAVGRRLGRPRAAVVVAFAVVVVASLGYSVLETARTPEAAYFVTPARMWQLGIGGLLACAPALARARRPVALAGWAALVGSLVVFDEGSPVPGWLTLVPVLGTAAVIAAGDAFLADRPAITDRPVSALLWVGAISYSLYLWHWPLVVLTPYLTGDPLTTTGRLVLLPVMLAVAGLSMRYVESPVRALPALTGGPLRRTFLPAVCAMVAVVLVGQAAASSAQGRLRDRADDLIAASDDRCFGAHAIANDCADPHRLRHPDAPLLRSGEDPSDEPTWGETCAQGWNGTAVVSCDYGVEPSRSERRVALVGDSHARQWTGALDEIAVAHDWTVVPMTKTSCPTSTDPPITRATPEYAESCAEWNRAVGTEIAEDPSIDVVVVSAKTRIYTYPGMDRAAQIDRMAAGYLARWREWTAAGKKVVVIADIPRLFVGDVPTCVGDADTADDPCTTPRAEAIRPDPLRVALDRATDDPAIVPVDLTRYFCDDTTCHSVIGGVVAYGDTNHILGYFSRSLAPYLYDQISGSLS